MAAMVEREGGCQCGKVRYRARFDPEKAYLCHCRMCQRATGHVAAALVGLKQADLAWIGEPAWYRSSAIAQRPFCPLCGTPLGFRYDDSARIDLTVGTLDDLSGITPFSHFGAESIQEAWLNTSHLPRQRADEYQPLRERWARSGTAMPG